MKPQVIDELLRETYDRDPAVRKHATRELCPCSLHVDRAEVWERIFELTEDDDVGVRRIALHTLIDGSPRDREADVVAALEGMRNDTDLKLRRQVRKLLARYRSSGKINH